MLIAISNLELEAKWVEQTPQPTAEINSFWVHSQCFVSQGFCIFTDPVDIEPYRHYIDAFLEALDRAQEPEEEWP